MNIHDSDDPKIQSHIQNGNLGSNHLLQPFFATNSEDHYRCSLRKVSHIWKIIVYRIFCLPDSMTSGWLSPACLALISLPPILLFNARSCRGHGELGKTPALWRHCGLQGRWPVPSDE
jgi:hypothetical protein